MSLLMYAYVYDPRDGESRRLRDRNRRDAQRQGVRGGVVQAHRQGDPVARIRRK